MAAESRADADAAPEAATELGRLQAELAGLEALQAHTSWGLPRVGDVLYADAGYEAALAAALGPLADAFVSTAEEAALEAARAGDTQSSVVYPQEAPAAEPGSLVEHVRCDPAYADIARRLLGRIVVDRDVTRDGVYRAPGLVRAGRDARAELAARRKWIRSRISELGSAVDAAAGASDRALSAERRLGDLRAQAAEAGRITETRRLMEAALAAEQAAAERLPELEHASAEAEDTASRLEAELAADAEALRDHRTAAQRLDAERVRWRDRAEDLGRQLHVVRQDVTSMAHIAEDRAHRLGAAEAAAGVAAESLPGLREAAAAAHAQRDSVEVESPEEEAELAEGARRLVALEEARIDSRLKTGTLEGNLELITRESELLAARMEEIRSRMPDGVAPEDIPGGKAREREMRTLEKRLEEIGPTNALADAECRELEERYSNLHQQLADITAARTDLETLIGKLREEEETRYDAVFGAVAANFHEFFSQLAPGGRATLRHAEGDDGPRTGVEILVQPPRKRLQNVTLLSSGERSLAALALVLALDEVNPSPFTILDEVDAALDDANVGRFGEMVARLGAQRQFVVITHNHVTMSHASTLYGIHLDESGTSHIVSVRLEDVRKPAVRQNPASRAG
jgi:chromosome segregation protein